MKIAIGAFLFYIVIPYVSCMVCNNFKDNDNDKEI